MNRFHKSLLAELAVAVLVLSPLATSCEAQTLGVSVGDTGMRVGVALNLAPPALPIYQQSPLPAPGYLWVPGYWAWGQGGYYWVPGTWVLPPEPGLLWTPGYWSLSPDGYVFIDGYWGSTVGFYGGIDYGFGYTGQGYHGGRWHGSEFVYNRQVNNVGDAPGVKVYSGPGRHGPTTTAGPSHRQLPPGGALRSPGRVVPQTHEQVQHATAAAQNPGFFANGNRGVPPVAATPRPSHFSGPGVVPARPAQMERERR